MNKKVKFYPIQGFEDLIIYPKPAKNNIQEWYKKMPTEIRPLENKLEASAKRCMPLFDAMTAGYYFYSYADVSVMVEHGCSKLEWLHHTEVIGTHPREQLQGMPLPEGFYKDEAFKWFNPVVMKTPPGYSTLFLTPILRFDLPFHSFPAIVDTDNYEAAIHFPFVLKKNWSGIIRKGTPIVQAIPFKREKWTSSLKKDLMDNDLEISKIKTFINSAYKKTWWVKKEWL